MPRLRARMPWQASSIALNQYVSTDEQQRHDTRRYDVGYQSISIDRLMYHVAVGYLSIA